MWTQLVFLGFLATVAQAQIPGNGSCPAVMVVPEFDVAAYLGTWYQIARFPNVFELGNCSTANYGPVEEGGLVKVVNTEIVNGNLSSIEGTAELTNPNATEAKLTVKFIVGNGVETSSPYWVLGTDYQSFTVVFSCLEPLQNLHFQSVWVLGRTKPLPEVSQRAVERILADNSIDASLLEVHELPECTTQP